MTRGRRQRTIPVPPLVDGGTTDVGAVEIAPALDLITLDYWNPSLRLLDYSDPTQTLFQVRITLAGYHLRNGEGLTVHPQTGQLFALLRDSSGNDLLTTVDLSTGNAALVGVLGDRFNAIAFDGSGALFGVTAAGAATPNSLFELDPATAASTLVVGLGTNRNEQALAFHPQEGALYHTSGWSSDFLVQTIDLGAGNTVAPVPQLPIVVSQVNASAFVDVDGGLLLAEGSQLRMLLPSGQVYPIGTLNHFPRGMVVRTPQFDDSTVTGTVLSAGVPLAGVQVTSDFGAAVVTDAQGVFSIPVSVPTARTLTFRVSGAGTVRTVIVPDVVVGGTTNVGPVDVGLGQDAVLDRRLLWHALRGGSRKRRDRRQHPDHGCGRHGRRGQTDSRWTRRPGRCGG